MTIFTDAERKYFTEMRAITSNSKGEEVLVGLDIEETAFYLAYAHQQGDQRQNEKDRDRYLQLHHKHERNRLAMIAAEIQPRNENLKRY